MSDTIKQVSVPLDDRSYEIMIGSSMLQNAGIYLTKCLPKARFFILTDENVEKYHLAALQESLQKAYGEECCIDILAIPPGEGSKSFARAEEVIHAVLNAKLERGDALIALGGGVVGDLAGFVAAITRRGMHFVQVPTSLLAQVDSSVGGKTGVNAPHGKNLIGAFYQPKIVLSDTDVLNTLPERDFRSGYAEVAKYGLINDEQFFNWLETNWQDIFNGDNNARAEAIAVSCRAKAKIVAADEQEQGQRALLNLGHTFGHALEAATGYSHRLLHGEGVAIGMMLAFQFSQRLNYCDGQDVSRVQAHLKAVGLPHQIKDIAQIDFTADDLLEHIYQDKKVSRSQLTFILVKGIGKAYIEKDVDPTHVLEFLKEMMG